MICDKTNNYKGERSMAQKQSNTNLSNLLFGFMNQAVLCSAYWNGSVNRGWQLRVPWIWMAISARFGVMPAWLEFPPWIPLCS